MLTTNIPGNGGASIHSPLWLKTCRPGTLPCERMVKHSKSWQRISKSFGIFVAFWSIAYRMSPESFTNLFLHWLRRVMHHPRRDTWVLSHRIKVFFGQAQCEGKYSHQLSAEPEHHGTIFNIGLCEVWKYILAGPLIISIQSVGITGKRVICRFLRIHCSFVSNVKGFRESADSIFFGNGIIVCPCGFLTT